MAMTEVFMGNSKQYTDEFRAEAVKQVIERGFTVVDVIEKPSADVDDSALDAWLDEVMTRISLEDADTVAGLQRVQRAEDGGVAETLGDTARIEGIEGFGGGVVADMNGLHGNSPEGEGTGERILLYPMRTFLDPSRQAPR